MAERPLALVTGGRRSIGRAIATGLAKGGFDLAITDLAADDGDTVDGLAARGAATLYLQSDLADIDGHAATIDAVVERFGRIDCLVNNAGIAPPVRGDLLELTPENFDRVMAVNLRGTLFLTQAVAKRMLELGERGHPRSIVTISSANAEMATVVRGDYCISKAGVSMLTKLFALRLAEAGIATFEVRPGLIHTDMTAVVREHYGRLIEQRVVPLGRWGEPDDIAEVVAGLASGAFRFATGSVIAADGGLAIPRF